jgi:hypothetical protein
MAMALYACTFKWIIERINARVKGISNYASIGILDIFGFENFEVSFTEAKHPRFQSYYSVLSPFYTTKSFLTKFMCQI